MRFVKNYLATIILLFLSMFALVPFYIMFVMGTHMNEELFRGIKILPGHYLVENLKTVISSGFMRAYANSIFISVTATILCLLVSSLAGFAFAKYHFKYKNKLFYVVLISMMVPEQLGLVALVIQFKHMNLLNSHIPLILLFGAVPFGVFWMTQYIEGSIPNEVLESARIDGCTELQTFFNIVIHFIKPALSTLAILIFMWSWNSFQIPLVMINKTELNTIPLAIANLKGMYRTDFAAQILGLCLGTLPLIIIFTIGSKHFIQGMTAGAVKG